MKWHPIQGGVDILQVGSCYGNQNLMGHFLPAIFGTYQNSFHYVPFFGSYGGNDRSGYGCGSKLYFMTNKLCHI